MRALSPTLIACPPKISTCLSKCTKIACCVYPLVQLSFTCENKLMIIYHKIIRQFDLAGLGVEAKSISLTLNLLTVSMRENNCKQWKK